MPWKRALAIVGFIAIVILLGFLVYLVFFRPAPPPKTVTQPPPPLGGLPTSGDYTSQTRDTTGGSDIVTQAPSPVLPQTAQEAEGGPVQTTEIFQDPLTNIELTSDGKNIVGYNVFDGRFYRIDRDGVPTKLSDQTFFGAQQISWSPRTDKATIEFADGSNVVYNFDQQKQTSLPSHWTSFDFGQGGDKVAFKSIGEDPDNRWFAVANSDGTNAKVLEDLGDKAGQFTSLWSPTGQIAGYFREGIDFDRQELYFIGLNKENFKSVVVNGRGLEAEWSPDGARLLHSVYTSSSDFKPELWVVDAIGDRIGSNRRRLNLMTWAHKCTFGSAEIVYCAVPTSLPEGAGLMSSVGDNGEDHIYRVDLATGERTRVAQPSEPHTIDRVIASDDQSMLYFTDKNSGGLYTIKL